MKPYGKTYRVSKDHRATECGLCKERVSGVGTYSRLLGMQDVEVGIEDSFEERSLDEVEKRLRDNYDGAYLYEWYHFYKPYEWGGDMYDIQWIDPDDHMKGWDCEMFGGW